MTAPACGTYGGANAHWKAGERPCDPCADAAYRYKKRRVHEARQGHVRRLPILGYRRRYQALQAIGWTHREIAAGLGVSVGCLSNRIHRNQWISAANFRIMAEFYEASCMTVRTGLDRTRTLRNAERRGYAPPLAWDDIDDPDEQPNLGSDTKRDTLTEYRFLRSLGVSTEQAARQLGITVDGIEQAIRREKAVA